ncbi:MAG: twin-arginine translocase TatA/TatE family subunit [Deltaproteobacteria bacterium]|nr:twin-arginine translocase TatA/TatE family subunit [Deltaproteobacteria bacterium]
MFGIGLPEMILIMALALIVVGPDKLPDLARTVAKGVLELKKTVASLKENFAEENPFDSVKPELEEAAKSLKKQLSDPAEDAWRGIMPEGGINPLDNAGDNEIIDSEILEVKDGETLAAEDIAYDDSAAEDTDEEVKHANNQQEQQPLSSPSEDASSQKGASPKPSDTSS